MATKKSEVATKPGRGGRRNPGPGKQIGRPKSSELVPLNSRVRPEERAALDRWAARNKLGQSEAVRTLLGGLLLAETQSEIRVLYDSLISRLHEIK